MNEIQTILFVDVLVVFNCCIFLLLFGRIAHSHPAVIYIFFHLYMVTTRLLGLSFDAQTLFTDGVLSGLFQPVTNSEIVRAVILADVALVVMTICWIKAAADASRHRSVSDRTAFRVLSIRYIKSVAMVAFPLGILGIALFASIPGLTEGGLANTRVALGSWETSSWLFILVTWSGLVILALIYWYGFRWWLSIAISIYLLLMMYQGFHRFRVIIPIILMSQIYLDRRRIRWPPVQLAILVAVAALLFFPLKGLGRAAQLMFSEDETKQPSISEILSKSTDDVKAALSGQAGDQQFLDEFAMALTLVDDNGKYYYGSIYLPLFTLPIPRQFWLEKPGLADYLKDISKPWRPMDQLGMIITILGESYLNFGYVGIIIIPGLLAYGLGRVYFYAYRSHYYTVVRFAYLVLACNLIQVYRDGLLSIVVFTLVNMMPLMLIIILHYVVPFLFGSDTPREIVDATGRPKQMRARRASTPG